LIKITSQSKISYLNKLAIYPISFLHQAIRTDFSAKSISLAVFKLANIIIATFEEVATVTIWMAVLAQTFEYFVVSKDRAN